MKISGVAHDRVYELSCRNDSLTVVDLVARDESGHVPPAV